MSAVEVWQDVALFEGGKPTTTSAPLPVGSVVFNHTPAPALDGLPKPTPQEWAAWEDLRTDVQRQRFLRDRPHGELKPLEHVRFIGLGHKARQGKNLIANVIHARYPLETERYAIADGIKAFCRVQYGMGEKDAPLLQTVGTDIRRRDPGVWIRALYWQIAEALPPVAIITDIRTKAEAAWIKQMGGIVVDIQRFNPDGSRFVDPSRDPNHITEIDLDGYEFDYELTNNVSLKDVSAAAIGWYDTLKYDAS